MTLVPIVTRRLAQTMILIFCVSTPLSSGVAQGPGPEGYLDIVRAAEEKSRNQAWREAETLWARAAELNSVEGRNWLRLGTARLQAKEYSKAIEPFEKALELGAAYSWLLKYNIARCYARIGRKEEALSFLRGAFKDGFRGPDQAQAEADLESLRDDSRFREIVGAVDLSKSSRVEGWRADLRHLVREIERIHYSPYGKTPREEFQAQVAKLSEEIPRLSDNQATVRVMHLMQLMGDGHSTISGSPEAFRRAPVQFYLFAEGLFIIAASPEHADLIGAQVLKIGDSTPADALAALRSVISRDNDMWPKYIGPLMLRNTLVMNGLGLIADGEKLPLTVRDETGKVRSVVLPAGTPSPLSNDWPSVWKKAGSPEPLYLKNRAVPYWYEYLPDSKTVYVQYNQVQDKPDEPLPAFCERLFKFINDNPVEKLVIDMRWNGGGNNFLNRPLVHGLIRNDKINRRGKLFVIIGRNTFSAAMNGATEIERHTNAIFVGEPTGSRPNFIGETIGVVLPYSKMRGSISGLYWQSSVAMDYRTWIAPALYVPPTFEMFRANRDPAMEAIMKYKD